MAKKNLAICIPSGRQVDFSFFKSFAHSIGEIMLTWNTAIFTVSSPFVQENRNEILRNAFLFEEKSGLKFDYFLWLDTDMIFSFSQIKSLISRLEEGCGFVSGVYYNPKESEILPVAYKKSGERYKWLSEKDLSGLMEVDATGFGFCAINSKIMKAVYEKHFPRPFDLRYFADGGLAGEDQVFCERAKELGYKIMLDCLIVVKHAKGHLPR